MATKKTTHRTKTKIYTPEFKLNAVTMLRECNNATKVARACRIPRTTLLMWNKKQDKALEENTELQAVEVEILQQITDAKRHFIDTHYTDLSRTFKSALNKTENGLKNISNPLVAVTIAEKLANIIKMFAVAEDNNASCTEDLLTACLSRINKK